MKTKIKTIIAMAALGMIGFININAVADNKKIVNSEVVNENMEMSNMGSWISEQTLIYSAEEFSDMDIQEEIEKYDANQILLPENTMVKSDSLNSVESMTTPGVDQEIEKYANKQVALALIRNGK